MRSKIITPILVIKKIVVKLIVVFEINLKNH